MVFILLEKVRRTITKFDLFHIGDRVIVGFSGGIDSVALLHVLHSLTEYQLDLWAVYINYGLRPAENLCESQLLQKVSELWEIQGKQFACNIPERLKEKPQSIQILAREERYRVFKDFSREIGAAKVALGHHRDDQAETILYRIIRGTGLDGLAGIPVRRDQLFVRPFLEITRSEIIDYAKQHQLTWVEDSSNRKLVYGRNKIRHQLLPLLEESYNPRIREALLRLGGLAGECHDFIETQIQDIEDRILVREPERSGFGLEHFLKLHPYLQYGLLKKLSEALSPDHPFEVTPLRRLQVKICSEQEQFKQISLGRGIAIYHEKGMIYFDLKKTEATLGQEVFVEQPGRYPISATGQTFELIKVDFSPEWGMVDTHEAFFTTPAECFPLQIRFWRPGDWFRPFGMAGKQKLQHFFINQKVPRRLRGKIPLLVGADGRIIWVAGYRVSEEFKVTPSSQEIWHGILTPAG